MRTLFKGFASDGRSEPERKTILVENDRIIAVEKEIYGSSAADRIYSFKDEIISPGFIDVHGHSDMSAPAAPAAESRHFQGVTGEISGNCGLSPFPVTGMNREHLQNLYADYSIKINWDDLPGYRNFLDGKKIRLRLHPLCGHNTLRAAVAGYEKKELSDSELKKMQLMLTEALKSGAAGMSAGLLYAPGCFAGDREITELMKTIAACDKVFAIHLRSEGEKLLESLYETLSCAGKAGLKKVEISHLKTAGKSNWHKLDAVMEMISDFRSTGMDVRFDRYPYIESQTMLSVILPAPFDTMPDREITRTLRLKPQAVSDIRHALQKRGTSDWDRWRITGTTHPYWKNFIGRKYTELPGDRIEAVVEQLTFDAVSATIGAAGMSAENMSRIITSPLCMAGSDGFALDHDSPSGNSHPRSFGAVAKFIRLRLDSGISIGNTVKAVTSAPAEFFSLPETGFLSPGKKADITIFSPDEIDSHADFADPRRAASGIRLTMFDGSITHI